MGARSVKSFTDTQGRVWDVAGSLGAFERVKSQCGVDVLDITSTQESLRQLQDVFTLGRVMYQMCAAQAEQRGISPESFAEGFNADVLHEASNALLDEVVFFCRKEMRPMLQMALEKAKAADQRMMQKVAARTQEIETEMDRALESLSTSTAPATSSLESSACIPVPGRSASSFGRRTGSRKRAGTTPQP
jgi:hypothetical protein